MWRHFGHRAYALILVLVIAIQAVAMAVLMWILGFRLAGRFLASTVFGVLLGVVSLTAFALIVVSSFIFGFHALSRRDERYRSEQAQAWGERWVEVLFADGKAPEPPLGREATQALLDLREVLKGTEGERVLELVARYRLAPVLVAPLRSRRLVQRLEALELLAKARLPETFDPVLLSLHDPIATVRLSGARAAARTLAAMEPGRDRDRSAVALAEALHEARLPAGAMEETLLLAQDAAGPLISGLLRPPWRSSLVVRAALEATGRLRLVSLAEDAGRLLVTTDPEIRAATLRAFLRLKTVPSAAEEAVLHAVGDPVEFVRIQAVQAARLLPPEHVIDVLGDRLGDLSWWVRRRSAESLFALGAPGERVLRDVAETHEDPVARAMAREMLTESGDPEGAVAFPEGTVTSSAEVAM